MIKRLYPYRFEIFLFSQMIIIFNSIVFPGDIFAGWIGPLSFQINFVSALILLSKKKKLMGFFGFMVIITTFLLGTTFFPKFNQSTIWIMRTFVYLIFYFFVTTEIIQQVWKIKNVNSKAILGMIAGYISLGLVGFFFLSFVYAIDHESFSTLSSPSDNLSLDYVQDKLLYFSFITLLTIGYGDMVPLTPIAQKTTIFIGLSGQMYLTIITAIVVGKFLNKKKD